MLSRRSFLVSGVGALATPSLLMAQRTGANEREIVPQLAANDKEDVWTLHFQLPGPAHHRREGAGSRHQDHLVHGLPRLQPRPEGAAGPLRTRTSSWSHSTDTRGTRMKCCRRSKR